MKNIIPLLVLWFTNIIFSQADIKGKFIPISEIANYDFLAPILKDKKIVLLGEQSHGDGATFDEKVNLIKHLHEKLGFNTIVFESGMYDSYKANTDFISKKEKVTVFDQAIGNIWSDTQSFKELMLYVDACAKKKDTIKILGFDCQEASIFGNYYLTELESTLTKHQIKFSKKTIVNLEKAFVSKDFEIFITNQNDATALLNDFEYITKSLNKISKLSANDRIIKQTFSSKIADLNFAMSQFQNQKIVAQNPRDEQMAKNLIFLSQLYPKEKMICWGASYHFAKSLQNYEDTPITEDYLQKQSDLEKATTGYSDYNSGDGKQLLEGALPMGAILKEHFKDSVYSIAFSSIEGSYGVVNTKPYPIFVPPTSSIENQLFNNNNNKVFFEFDNSNSSSFYSSILGNIPIKNKWDTSFDALLFIKKSYPPVARTYEKGSFINNQNINYKISGKIIDSKDNKPISNVEISVKDSKVNISADNNGFFAFTLEKNQLDKKIIVSAFNYISDTLSIGNLVRLNKKFLNIKLKKQNSESITLSEVRIANDYKLSAKDIVLNARNYIAKNYSQNPFNQDFYYKTESIKNEKNSTNTEAIIKTYHSKGMKSYENPDNSIYAEVKQLRNIKNRTDEYYYTDTYGFAFMFNKDPILSKSNVLHRTSAYELTNEGKQTYDNKKVYKISFENNSPGSYSTGFGYPAPRKSSGYLLVNADDFAVVKYEHCVIRQPYETKDKRIMNVSHKIYATYKKTEQYYFINQLAETTKSAFSSKNEDDKEKSVNIIYYTKTLKSTSINTQNIELISRPVLKLVNSKPFTEDTEFWKNNLLLINMNKLEIDVCE